jgi:hypothetical protein
MNYQELLNQRAVQAQMLKRAVAEANELIKSNSMLDVERAVELLIVHLQTFENLNAMIEGYQTEIQADTYSCSVQGWRDLL